MTILASNRPKCPYHVWIRPFFMNQRGPNLSHVSYAAAFFLVPKTLLLRVEEPWKATGFVRYSGLNAGSY